MNESPFSAVVFADDHVKVAAFYREVLGLPCVLTDADHTVLNCGNVDLVIHQIAGPCHETSLHRRDCGAIRLNFTVKSVPVARRIAASLGGQIDSAPPPWAPPDVHFRLGHDPEGNVFLVNERAL